MFKLNIEVGKLEIDLRTFSDEELQAIGETAVDAIRDRWARGHNVQDLPAKPLTEPYKRRKLRRGLQGIRDWNFSGELGRSLSADVKGDEIEINVGIGQAFKLWKLQQEEQMLPLAPSDIVAIDAKANEIARTKDWTGGDEPF